MRKKIHPHSCMRCWNAYVDRVPTDTCSVTHEKLELPYKTNECCDFTDYKSVYELQDEMLDLGIIENRTEEEAERFLKIKMDIFDDKWRKE